MHRGAEALDRPLRVRERLLGQEDDELLAAVAVDAVALAELALERLGHPAQHVVAREVTEMVVVRLEAIDVADRERVVVVAVAAGPGPEDLQVLLEAEAVGDLRQGVEPGLVEGALARGAQLGVPRGEPAAPRGDQRGTWITLPASSDALVGLARAPAAAAPATLDVLDASGVVTRRDLAGHRARVLGRPPRPLPHAAEGFALVDEQPVVAAFDALVALGAPGWSRATQRGERVLAFADTLVASSGTHLGWLTAATGALVHEADAGVGSSWIEYLVRVDDDRFLVMGYDEDRLQLWSCGERARIAELALDHRDAGGGLERPYGLCYHPASGRLLVSYWDYQVDVIAVDARGLRCERTLALHQPMQHLALTDDGATLIVGHEHRLYGFAYPALTPRWRYASTRELSAIAALPDGRVAAGCADGTLIVLG